MKVIVLFFAFCFSLLIADCNTGNAVLRAAVNAALREMLDPTDTDSFSKLQQKYFPGTPYPYPLSGANCTLEGVWPSNWEFSSIVASTFPDRLLLGGAGVPDPPDRENCTLLPGKTNIWTCAGYDADILAAIAKKISNRYSLFPALAPAWVHQRWYYSLTDNVIANLKACNYHLILSSMTTTANWKNPLNESETVPRASLIDFSCAYQNGGDAAVCGPKALPPGALPLTTPEALNQTGIVVCVQSGTSMENWAKQNCRAATINATADGTLPVSWVTDGTCHCYIAPASTAASDVSKKPALRYVGLTQGTPSPTESG